MDYSDKRKRKGRKAPKRPIKTYKWEDIRRSRIKGGYPWTYLYKRPFDASDNLLTIKMEPRNKNKSIVKNHDEIIIEEVLTPVDSESSIDIEGIVTEPITELKNYENQCVSVNSDLNEDDSRKVEFTLESAESSDNISQYLDKEERGPNKNISNFGNTSVDIDNPSEKSKSEDLKRKRSLDRNSSKISISKLGALRKLLDTKEKVKSVKMSFSTLKENAPKNKPLPSVERKGNYSETRKEEKPIYIHIPLNPPAEEQNEFSCLEFKEKNVDLKPDLSSLLENKEKFVESEEQEITEEYNVYDVDKGTDICEIKMSTSNQDSSTTNSRTTRSKSAEPENKRKLSLESSYSRKSLSKLGILKKIIDASEKLKLPTSLLPRKRESRAKNKNKTTDVKQTENKKSSHVIQNIEAKPIYIHIPLKVSKDDVTFDKKEISEMKKEVIQDKSIQINSECNSKIKKNDVQLIFLTAPSDDEVLDDNAIPETPSSENSFYFGTKIEELKKIAKDIVDEITPETKRKVLDTVVEETDKNIIGNEYNVTKNDTIQKPNIADTSVLSETEQVNKNELIDEEDGLQIQTYLDTTTGASSILTLNKKVEFKRPFKIDKKNTGCEDVDPSKSIYSSELCDEPISIESKITELESSQSISVEDEQVYRDQKIIKSSSLEEDYNQWSKLSDHEYEPVNPPSNNAPVVVSSINSTEVKTEFRVTNFNEENEQANVPHPPSSKISEVVQSVVENSSPSKNVHEQNIFQKTLKLQKEKLKTKIGSIKPSNILLRRPNMEKSSFSNIKMLKSKLKFPKIPSIANTDTKRTLSKRKHTTESNVQDSKKSFFDFHTYPRILKKKSKAIPKGFDFATVPRSNVYNKPQLWEKSENKNRNVKDTIRIPLHSEDSMDDEIQNTSDKDNKQDTETSHIGYDKNIDNDDVFEKEIVNEPQWNSTSFDDIQECDNHQQQIRKNSNENNEINSSESSLEHQRGVLEEINADEFFLRQKGISQDNIEVGIYLSSEIREAFKEPISTLSQIKSDKYFQEYSPRGSNQSLPDANKYKFRKPKRHISQEYALDVETEQSEELPPIRPTRKSKRHRAYYREDGIIPHRETIQLDNHESLCENGTKSDEESITNDEQILHLFQNSQYNSLSLEFMTESEKEIGHEPTLEQDSILGEYNIDREISCEEHSASINEYITKSQELPVRPSRKYFRKKSSHVDNEPPQKPRRNFRRKSQSDNMSDVENNKSCVQDKTDYMGYAIVDKQKIDESSFSPKIAPRRSSIKCTKSTTEFSSELNDTIPVRPLRNYSTLKKKTQRTNSIEKLDLEISNEIINISQNSETENPIKTLQSGATLKKIQNRPLPAPPRPPRKSYVKDITSDENLAGSVVYQDGDVGTQTDSVLNEGNMKLSPERVILPPRNYSYEETITHGTLLVEPLNNSQVEINSELFSERIIPLKYESESETLPKSNICREQLDNVESKKENEENLNLENSVIKAQKLIISDLDVERLTVNELTASKITVFEIDGENIQINEICAKSGELKIGETDLPANIVKVLLNQLHNDLDKNLSENISVCEKQEKENNVSNIALICEEPITRTYSGDVIALSNDSVQIIHDRPKLDSTDEHIRRSSNSNEGDTNSGPLRSPREVHTSNLSEITDPKVRLEPDIDDSLPPNCINSQYITSQPPASFYALRAQEYVDNLDENIPSGSRKRRKRKILISRSTSEESIEDSSVRRHYTSSEPSITKLTGQLACACISTVNGALKRLIKYVKNNVENTDDKQDLNVMIVILLVLITGLILIGYGGEKTIHLHHWEYFNPPRDL